MKITSTLPTLTDMADRITWDDGRLEAVLGRNGILDERFRLRDERFDDQQAAIVAVDVKVTKLLERANQILVGIIVAMVTILGGALISLSQGTG